MASAGRLASACLFPSLTAALTIEAVNGVWEGKIHVDGQNYRLFLHFGVKQTGVPSPRSTVQILGSWGFPSHYWNLASRSVSFELNDPKVSFKGSLSVDNAELLGDWN